MFPEAPSIRASISWDVSGSRAARGVQCLREVEAEHRSRAVQEIGTDSVGQDGTRGTEGIGDRGCQRWIFLLPHRLFPSIARFA